MHDNPKENKPCGDEWFLCKSCRSKKKKQQEGFPTRDIKTWNAIKNEKMIFTPFGQKRKTLYKRNVLGTLFRPESQKREFPTFGSKKWKWANFSLLARFWRPKRSRAEKFAQKRKKRFCSFWAPKTCPEPYVFQCFALGAKIMLFRLSPIFAFLRFLDAQSVFGPKTWSKPPKTLKIRPFAPFGENGIQNT